MRTKYDEYLERLNGVRRMIGKNPIPRRDDYFTHLTELTALEKLGIDLSQHKDVGQLLRLGVHRNSPYFVYAQSRLGGKPILDAFKSFQTYEQAMLKFEKIAPTTAKLRELIQNEQTGFRLFEKNPSAYHFLNDFVNMAVTGKTKVFEDKALSDLAGQIDKIANIGRKNISVAYLVGNLSSALIQPTSLVMTTARIGPRYAARGILEMMDDGLRREAVEKSNVLLGRMFDVFQADVAGGALSRAGAARNKVADAVQKYSIGFMDRMSAIATWRGSYKQAIDRGMKEKDAIRYADDVVVKTQASAAPFELAPIQRTELGKTITTFQTYTIRFANELFDVFKEAENTKQIASRLATLVIGGTMMNYLYEDVLGMYAPFPRLVRGAREGYEKEGIVGAAKGVGKEVVEALPVVGATRFGGSMLGPVFEEGKKTLADIKAGKKQKAVFGAVTTAAGVPFTRQAEKTLEGAQAIKKGYVEVKKGGRSGVVPIQGLDKARALAFGPYATKEAKKEFKRLEVLEKRLGNLSEKKQELTKEFTKAIQNKDSERINEIINSVIDYNLMTVDTIVELVEKKQIDVYNLEDAHKYLQNYIIDGSSLETELSGELQNELKALLRSK